MPNYIVALTFYVEVEAKTSAEAESQAYREYNLEVEQYEDNSSYKTKPEECSVVEIVQL